MKKVKGTYYHSTSSKSSHVELVINDNRVSIFSDENNKLYETTYKKITIGRNIPGLPIDISFEDGAKFVPDDKNYRWEPNNTSFVSLLEGNRLFLLSGILLIPLGIYLFSFMVIPYGSQKIAASIPYEIKKKISQAYLDTEADNLSISSGLEENEKERIRKIFRSTVDKLDINKNRYNLIFFSSSTIGANAFALPDGTIIVMDELINLYEDNDDLLLSVLLHEIAHVEKNHGLTLVFQSIGTAVVLTYLLGDVSAISDFVITASSILSQQSFSRHMEYEADHYAATNLLELGKSTQHFVDALRKLSEYSVKDDHSVSSYFSTHPLTEDRINNISRIHAQ